MAQLRDPLAGCDWDRAQTWATIAPYTIEEAYEVADAIAREDVGDLKDELGDLLLQVVFHSRIAEEAGLFALDDVADAIGDKLERRHPHIFGDADRSDPDFWERIKAEERAAKSEQGAPGGALAGVAVGLPALTRAEKLQKRAARVGFDWPDAGGPRAKIDEELAEVAAADGDAVAEEIGDLLFAVVNWARHLGIDAEAALRKANAKFERRFAAMEGVGGSSFAALTLDEKQRLWNVAKNGAGLFKRPALEAVGFRGWVPLLFARASAAPRAAGIYVVHYPDVKQPAFLPLSAAGRFKGKDPTVSMTVAAANWVPTANIVYICKADDLRRRLVQFADFGIGKPVGHWGGRLVWQLPDPEALEVAWLETQDDDPASAEAAWLKTFRAAYGKPPFANDPQRMGN